MIQKVQIKNPNSMRGIVVMELVQHPKLYFVVAHNDQHTEFYHIGSGTLHRLTDDRGWMTWLPKYRCYTQSEFPDLRQVVRYAKKEASIYGPASEEQATSRMERL